MWPNGYGPEWNRKNYNDPMPNYPDSDESDSDEMLPLGAFWPSLEEEEWTIVGKPHGVQRYDNDIDCNRLHYTHDKLDRSGMCCKQLDYIDWNVTQYDSDKFLSERLVTEVGILNTDDVYTRSEVLPTRRNQAAQNDSSPSSIRKGPQSHQLTSEPVVTSVRPSFRKRPNVIAVETRKTASVPATRPVDIVPIPQVIVDENRCSGTVSGVKFPEQPDVSPAKIAEEANTGGATNEQHLHDDQNFKKTTNTKLPTDFIEIPEPKFPRVSLKWPKRPVSMVLRMDSAYTKIRTIRRRPLRNCPWIFSKYPNHRSWNWLRRPGTVVLKVSSGFLWTKFYHK